MKKLLRVGIALAVLFTLHTAASASQPEYETVQVHGGLTLSVPSEFNIRQLGGNQLTISLRQGTSTGTLMITPRQLDDPVYPTPLDENGIPILTLEVFATRTPSLRTAQDVTFTEHSRGSTTVGGMPAVYIKAEFVGGSWVNPQISRLVRVVYGNMRFDIGCSARVEYFDDELLAIADAIIATAVFAPGQPEPAAPAQEDDELHDALVQAMMDLFGPPDSTQQPAAAIPLACDTMRWINYANAINIILDGRYIGIFGGSAPSAAAQFSFRNMLRSGWGITDRHSLDAQLSRLYHNGHRVGFHEVARTWSFVGLDDPEEIEAEFERRLETNPQLVEKLGADGVRYFYQNLFGTYYEFGEDAFLSWDLNRMINLIQAGLFLEFYTLEEALDLTYMVAQKLQLAYSSWDDLFKNFLSGFDAWNGGTPRDETSENFRRYTLWRELQSSPTGPYSLAWETQLTPSWQQAIRQTSLSEYFEYMGHAPLPPGTYESTLAARIGAVFVAGILFLMGTAVL